MTAFDVTTKPTSLSLKPGSTGSIMVLVSNRLGRPVMGLVEGVLTPPSAAKWLVPAPDLQRRYEADPAATATYEFKVAVPKDAPAQPVQFKASVRDVLAPDDTRVEGQTVAINVTPKPVTDAPTHRIVWWPWAVAAVLVLGVALLSWQIIRPKGVPNVLGMSVETASAKLTKAGFAPVNVKDTVDEEVEDSTVVNQEPEAKSRLPAGDMKGSTPATIVVSRAASLPPSEAGGGGPHPAPPAPAGSRPVPAPAPVNAQPRPAPPPGQGAPVPAPAPAPAPVHQATPAPPPPGAHQATPAPPPPAH